MVCAGGAIGDNGRRTRRINPRRDNATLPAIGDTPTPWKWDAGSGTAIGSIVLVWW